MMNHSPSYACVFFWLKSSFIASIFLLGGLAGIPSKPMDQQASQAQLRHTEVSDSSWWPAPSDHPAINFGMFNMFHAINHPATEEHPRLDPPVIATLSIQATTLRWDSTLAQPGRPWPG